MGVSIFKIVESVLDELYPKISGTNAEKDKAIKAELAQLSSAYDGLRSAGRKPIDYADPLTRFAYIYRYVACHANLVMQGITSSKDLMALFDQERVQAVCVGGGPGSDLLGVLKFCAHHKKKPEKVTCRLYDWEQAWGETWEDVDDKLDVDFTTVTNYQKINVTDPATWAFREKFLQADLFTFVFFMSEVFAFKNKAQAFFETLFAKAKSGAYFLFVDNSTQCFADWFDSFVPAKDFRVLSSGTRDARVSSDEQKEDLGKYFPSLGNPRLTAKIAYRVVEKK